MGRPILIVATFFVALATISTKAQSTSDFQRMISCYNLTVSIPDTLIPQSPVSKNDYVSYSYTVTSKDGNIEVNYIFNPIIKKTSSNLESAMYERAQKANRNRTSSFCSYYKAIQMSITDGKLFQSQVVNPSSYNATTAINSSFKIRTSPERKYSFCYILGLHKENIADTFIILLSKKELFDHHTSFLQPSNIHF